VIIAIHILIEIVLVVILVLLCRLAIEIRRESKRESGVHLPTRMTIKKESDKTIYKFNYDD
jgi:uncharacterized membrane protein